MKINASLKNEIRERKHPTDPFHPVQRLFPFNGGSPLSPLPASSVLFSRIPTFPRVPTRRSGAKSLQSAAGFYTAGEEGRQWWREISQTAPPQNPNLSCCCVARRSFFFLCGCVNWPLWLSYDGFLPTWVWNVCSKWICGWKKDASGVCSWRFRSQKRPFLAAAPLAVADPSGLSRCHSPSAVNRNMDVYTVDVHVPADSCGRADEESRWVKIELYHDVSAWNVWDNLVLWCEFSSYFPGSLKPNVGGGASNVAFGHDNWLTDPADLRS